MFNILCREEGPVPAAEVVLRINLFLRAIWRSG